MLYSVQRLNTTYIVHNTKENDNPRKKEKDV